MGAYLGSSRKLGKQLQWANSQHARFVILYGSGEQEAGEVTVRDMRSGDQHRIPLTEAVAHLAAQVSTRQ